MDLGQSKSVSCEFDTDGGEPLDKPGFIEAVASKTARHHQQPLPDGRGSLQIRCKQREKLHYEIVLPRQIHEIHPPQGERNCPDCGQAKVVIGQDVTEALEVIPARFFVNRYVRFKYACRAGVVPRGLPRLSAGRCLRRIQPDLRRRRRARSGLSGACPAEVLRRPEHLRSRSNDGLDSDGDTISDGGEIAAGTNPCLADSDGDGVPDNEDPLPSEPGVTSGFLEDASRELGTAVVPVLELSLFSGNNNNADKGRRGALANRATEAGNLSATGDIQGAIDKFASLLAKIDGEPSPPDWMMDSPEKTALRSDVELLIVLLALEL